MPTHNRGRGTVSRLESRKPPAGDVPAQLGGEGRDELRDGDGLVFDEGLLVQTQLLVKLCHLSFDHPVSDVCCFTGCESLGTINVFFPVVVIGCHVFFPNELGVGSRNLHRDVVYQLLERFGVEHELALTRQFDEHSNFAPRVNVCVDSGEWQSRKFL